MEREVLAAPPLLGGAARGGGQPAGLAAAPARGRRPPLAGGGPAKYLQPAFRNSLHRVGIKGNGRPPNPPQHLVWPFISIFLLAGVALCRKNP
jgi:hypothetical protein